MFGDFLYIFSEKYHTDIIFDLYNINNIPRKGRSEMALTNIKSDTYIHLDAEKKDNSEHEEDQSADGMYGLISTGGNPAILRTAMQFQQIMLLYEGAVQQVKNKLDILSKEFHINNNRNPIDSIRYRIKEPMSIAEKLNRKGYEVTLDNMVNKLDDIAGIRVVCPFISDVYAVADMLTKQDDIRLIEKKDYVENPKGNGYRSLHLVLEVMVFLSDRKQPVRVEVQIRTIAMNFWASLEHQLRYKSHSEISESISEDLKECAEIIALTDKRMQRIKEQIDEVD